MRADVIPISVMAGDVFKKEILVPVADARITWVLYNVSHPVTLIVTPPAPPPLPDSCRDPLMKPRPLFKKRLNNQSVRQEGIVTCPLAGIYTLILDNSKDMIHVVKASAHLDVLTPASYMKNFAEQAPLGDSVNFYEPVTHEERKKRRELIQKCPQCPIYHINNY
ncbi:SEC14-like protein 3 [Elysia marginata]|uniref:SEC14-like protein 3 n=1 Tax=Elysia marginata TaxID=1093978 RepID=A0AAV4IFF7_9GAST|nr:SEC14-like protein 3 [Elysia marginata]